MHSNDRLNKSWGGLNDMFKKDIKINAKGFNQEQYQYLLKQIGANIKHYRKMNHLLQTELADKLRVSPSTITNLERGTVGITLKTLYLLAEMFHIHIAQLLLDEDTLCLSKKQVIHRIICEKID